MDNFLFNIKAVYASQFLYFEAEKKMKALGPGDKYGLEFLNQYLVISILKKIRGVA